MLSRDNYRTKPGISTAYPKSQYTNPKWPISSSAAFLQYDWRVEHPTENPPAEHLREQSGEFPAAHPTATETIWDWPDGFALDIARATRTWIQYGMLGFAVLCIVIGAVKGILGL